MGPSAGFRDGPELALHMVLVQSPRSSVGI